MTITGLDQVEDLLAALAQIPDQLATEAKEHPARVKVTESTRGLYTQNRVGRRIVAVTLPAVGKTAWISVLDPRAGTSRGGDRTRYSTREAALDNSRTHTLEVAAQLADRLSARQWSQAPAELDRLLGGL